MLRVADYTAAVAEHYTAGFERKFDIRWLVIHGTGGGGIVPYVRRAGFFFKPARRHNNEIPHDTGPRPALA